MRRISFLVVEAAALVLACGCDQEGGERLHDEACVPPTDPTQAIFCIRQVTFEMPWSIGHGFDSGRGYPEPWLTEQPNVLFFEYLDGNAGTLQWLVADRPTGPCTYSLSPWTGAEALVRLSRSSSTIAFASGGWSDPFDGFVVDLTVCDHPVDPIICRLTIPLRHPWIMGTMLSDRSMIGRWSWGEEAWTDGGVLSGYIAVSDARDTPFWEYLSEPDTLCGLLAGELGESGDAADDCLGDPDTWMNEPDAVVDGEPGWLFEATFAAEACAITS